MPLSRTMRNSWGVSGGMSADAHVMSTTILTTTMAVDPSSLSNTKEAWTTHLSLEWTLDFEKKRIFGRARHTVKKSVGASTFVVDTSGGLRITKATVDGVPVEPSLGKTHPVFGTPVSVPVGETVEYEYETGDECTAAQWLDAAQTADKEFPFLFTQCQAIHARSLFPCQDTPGAKLTWDATVHAPEWATVLMSGLKRGDGWSQPRPTSTYLIAIICARIEKRDISKRCAVWAEPSVVDKALFDFAQTETFLAAAEEIADLPYAWGRYDLVCLPPSFPYGGMESQLTFVTPTLLAGDRSLAGVVAHEIAHSWTGNLVTNATWQAFFLNEGWTRWFERKIKAFVECGDVTSKEAKDKIDFDVALSRKALVASIKVFEEAGQSHLTALVPPLDGVDPDEAFSLVPYEKGSGLLSYLEHLVGTVNFGRFFQRYLRTFQDKTITAADFKTFVEAELPGAAVDWDAWYTLPGDMPQKYPLSSTYTDQVDALVAAWKSGERPAAFEEWDNDRRVYFLDRIAEEHLDAQTLDDMDVRYKLTATTNAEIRFRAIKLLLAAGVARAVDLAVHMATTQGRMKFTRPLYRALAQAPIPGAQRAAQRAFADHQSFYHPICRKMVHADLTRLTTSPRRAISTALVLLALGAILLVSSTRRR